jgi:hypothetical protein
MRQVSKPKRPSAHKPAARKAVTQAKLRALREQAKAVRRQVAQDREQIAANRAKRWMMPFGTAN